MKLYNKTNTCDRCKVEKLIPRDTYREYDNKGEWTLRWLCRKCWKNDYDDKPDSHNNIIKSLANRRIGYLDPYSTQAKGDIFEEITCIFYGVKNLNVENDNFCSPIDHSRDSKLGILQSKGSVYNYGYWQNNVENEHGKCFDNMIYYCMNKDMKNVERVYIFPIKEVIIRRSIKITKNPSRGPSWYEKYRVDEKPFDRIYQMIKTKNQKDKEI